MEALRIALDASRDNDALVFMLREFRAGDLIPGATGTLRAKADGTAPALELRVPVLDLERMGAAALAVAGDLHPLRMAVGEVRGGTLRELTLHAAAGDLARLADLLAIRAEARVDAATVAVPAAGIVVKDGSGRFLMAEGILQGSQLAGDIGRSSFSSGALAAAFLPAPSLRSLHGTFKADLTDALAISRRLTRGNPEALAGIEALQGRASATIDYEAGRKGSPLIVELKGIQATGRYRAVPLPLAVNRGDLRYSGVAVSVSGLAGSAGGSRLSNAAIDIAFGREPAIRSASGDATLVLDEIHPLIASLEHVRLVLGEIKSATGTAAVRLVRLSGPLTRPASLDFDITVQPQQLRLTSAALPGPLTLAAGSVSVYRHARCGWNASRDAARCSGHGFGNGGGLRGARAAREPGIVRGHARQGFRRMGARALEIPGRLAAARAGRAFRRAPRMDWRDQRRRSPRRAPPASRPACRRSSTSPGGRATSTCGIWRSRMQTAMPHSACNGRRSARNSGSAAASIIARSSGASRSLRGRASCSREFPRVDRPRGTTALDARTERSRSKGSTCGNTEACRVMVDRLNVDAAGRTLRVRDGVVRLAGERLALSGTVESREERFALDARVSADAARRRAACTTRSRGPSATRARPAPPGICPWKGRVVVTADLGGLRPSMCSSLWPPPSRLAPNRVVVEATDTRLCGIAAPFTAALIPGSVKASARLTARNQSLWKRCRAWRETSSPLPEPTTWTRNSGASGPA